MGRFYTHYMIVVLIHQIIRLSHQYVDHDRSKTPASYAPPAHGSGKAGFPVGSEGFFAVRGWLYNSQAAPSFSRLTMNEVSETARLDLVFQGGKLIVWTIDPTPVTSGRLVSPGSILCLRSLGSPFVKNFFHRP